MTAEIALVAVLLVGIGVWLTLARANRIDLLHQKVTRSAATLDAQLLRRAGLAAELARSGILDPATSILLGGAAEECLSHDPMPSDAALPDVLAGDHFGPHREQAESDLTRVLREGLQGADLTEDPLVADVLTAWRRAGYARRFHNDAVAQTIRLRSKLSVRLLRLAGHAPMPRMVDLDDALPTA
ncbi:hypothetical protein [Serinibacter salmoneus]|uniref:LemA protein n=1 Tax=Serinibacter salmoneus TaxID=556530 RepID=A0A2A9CYX2_9MICO|nr:hypothetical protein [Serinibacter salmoneus]PFG19603.1 hypothetical protein ATL40_1171 [Serinibacter salmoneus]